MNHSALHKLTVVVLMFATFLATTPVSAAELTTKTALGSISAVGSVDLRGVTVAGEGTLFTGDQVSVGSRSGAKIALVNGQKIVLDQLTNLTFAVGGQVQVSKGNVAFSSRSGQLDIVAGHYQIQGDRTLAGNVAFVGADYIGLRVNSGAATVIDLKTKVSHKITAGQERLFSTTTSSGPIATLASVSLPAAIPAVPAVPQVSTGSSGLTTAGWAALLATIGGAAVAIILLATRGDDSDDAAATVARQKALAATAAATSALTTADSNATAIAAATTAVNNAVAADANLSAEARATLTARASTIQSNIIASRTQIAALNNRINALNTQLQTADPTLVASIVAQINAAINDVNTTASQLNAQISLLQQLTAAAQNGGVTVPNPPQIIPIPTVPQAASASIPPK